MPPAASRRWAAPSSSWSCSIPATPPRRPRTRRSAWSPSTTIWSPRPAPICRSFTLAVTEVTERAKLPMLTLSYSDMITERGFDYIFQTSATSGSQAIQSLPTLVELAQVRRRRSEDRRDRHRQHRGLDLLGQADARASAQGAGARAAWSTRPSRRRWRTRRRLIQQLRTTRPDLFFFLPTVISDAKLVLEKMNEFGLGQGRIPTISFGIAIAEPDMLNTHGPGHPAGRHGGGRELGLEGPRGHDRAPRGALRRALDDPERDLDLWRHVDPQGRAREGRQRGPRGRGRGAAHPRRGPVAAISRAAS